jgi:hypothetical protein
LNKLHDDILAYLKIYKQMKASAHSSENYILSLVKKEQSNGSGLSYYSES